MGARAVAKRRRAALEGGSTTASASQRQTTRERNNHPVLGEDEKLSQRLRQAETIGRPLGSDTFVARLERKTGRILKPAKRGPKPAPEDGDES